MSLSKRLDSISGTEPVVPLRSVPDEGPWASAASPAPWTAVPDLPMQSGDASQAMTGVKERATIALYDRMGSRITESTMDELELHQYVKDELRSIIEADDIPLSAGERTRLVQE